MPSKAIWYTALKTFPLLFILKPAQTHRHNSFIIFRFIHLFWGDFHGKYIYWLCKRDSAEGCWWEWVKEIGISNNINFLNYFSDIHFKVGWGGIHKPPEHIWLLEWNKILSSTDCCTELPSINTCMQDNIQKVLWRIKIYICLTSIHEKLFYPSPLEKNSQSFCIIQPNLL